MRHLNKDLVYLILQFLKEENFKETLHMLEQESRFYFDLQYFQNEVLKGNWNEVESYLWGFIKRDDNPFFMQIFLDVRKQKESERLSDFDETRHARTHFLGEIWKRIKANPKVHDKFRLPKLEKERLKTLIGQSLRWQHHMCKYPKDNPYIGTLFVDHLCEQATRASGYSPFSAPGSFQPTPPTVLQPTSGGVIRLGDPTNTGTILKQLENNPIPKKLNLPMISVTYPGQSHGQPFNTSDGLPKTVACTLHQGSCPMSMDFHPVHQTLLLVGSKVGDIRLWDVGLQSVLFQESLKGHQASVKRIIWCPDGSFFGAAYSWRFVHVYSYHNDNNVRLHLQIDAHPVGVNDLAFSDHNKKLVLITCGEDKFIKVWDAATGVIQHTFEGHENHVYCVCPNSRANIQFVLSTGLDRKIKVWTYEYSEPRADYDAQDYCFTTIAYSADGLRLFSCGTDNDGNACLVELNDEKGTVKRIYRGFHKHSSGVVQFDTTKNKFLAAGDASSIKFWEMNKIRVFAFTDAGGGLPESPCIRFNKEGSLLAVSANENTFKILANADGLQLLYSSGNSSSEAPRLESSIPVIAAASTSGL